MTIQHEKWRQLGSNVHDEAAYRQALRDCGRTDCEIDAAVERNAAFAPMLWIGESSFNTAKFKAADYGRVLGPVVKARAPSKPREYSDAQLLRFVELARKRGLIA